MAGSRDERGLPQMVQVGAQGGHPIGPRSTEGFESMPTVNW
jgi:hypothetical protein